MPNAGREFPESRAGQRHACKRTLQHCFERGAEEHRLGDVLKALANQLGGLARERRQRRDRLHGCGRDVPELVAGNAGMLSGDRPCRVNGSSSNAESPRPV